MVPNDTAQSIADVAFIYNPEDIALEIVRGVYAKSKITILDRDMSCLIEPKLIPENLPKYVVVGTVNDAAELDGLAKLVDTHSETEFYISGFNVGPISPIIVDRRIGKRDNVFYLWSSSKPIPEGPQWRDFVNELGSLHQKLQSKHPDK